MLRGNRACLAFPRGCYEDASDFQAISTCPDSLACRWNVRNKCVSCSWNLENDMTNRQAKPESRYHPRYQDATKLHALVSKTVLDRNIVTTGHKQEVTYGLSKSSSCYNSCIYFKVICWSQSFLNWMIRSCKIFTDKRVAWSLCNSRAACLNYM